MFRFDACDLGLPIGGPLNGGLVPVGVLGADSAGGAKFDRARMALDGREALRSIADAARVGGPDIGCRLPPIPGEAVWALDGGGGGNDGFGVSSPLAFLLTQRFCSLS